MPAQRIKTKLTNVIRGLIAAGRGIGRTSGPASDLARAGERRSADNRTCPRDFEDGFNEDSTASNFLGARGIQGS